MAYACMYACMCQMSTRYSERTIKTVFVFHAGKWMVSSVCTWQSAFPAFTRQPTNIAT